MPGLGYNELPCVFWQMLKTIDWVGYYILIALCKILSVLCAVYINIAIK